jgi:hypothetical protein
VADTLIQLRLSEDEADELRDAGKTEGRSLPKEIQYRLHAYQSGVGVSRALGNLAAIIVERAGRHIPPTDNPQQDRAKLLATVRDALVWTLDSLGAEARRPAGDDFPLSQGISWDLVLAIKSSQPPPYGYGPGIDRIREALVAGLATGPETKGKQSKPERKHDDKKA